MTIKKILLDLDDTLNDFTMAALDYIGCEVIGPNDFAAFNPAWKFDILKAANALHPEDTFDLRGFWDMFDSHFWANLQESIEFPFILDTCLEAVGEKGVLICTSPICGPEISTKATTECLAGKYMWIREYLQPFLQRSFSIGPMKHFYASPDTLLIDDCDDNVEKFREAGGKAILVPRPWNKNHGLNPTMHLCREFRGFFR